MEGGGLGQQRLILPDQAQAVGRGGSEGRISPIFGREGLRAAGDGFRQPGVAAGQRDAYQPGHAGVGIQEQPAAGLQISADLTDEPLGGSPRRRVPG